MRYTIVHFETVLYSRIRPCLAVLDLLRAAMVCKDWYRILTHGDSLERSQRTLTEDEIDTVVQDLRAPKLPWSIATEEYLRSVLRSCPSVCCASDLPRLSQWLLCLYNRGLVSPKTNIGTLDTTRVIERLTQARLSRFHSTGAASIQQASALPRSTERGSGQPGESVASVVEYPASADVGASRFPAGRRSRLPQCHRSHPRPVVVRQSR